VRPLFPLLKHLKARQRWFLSFAALAASAALLIGLSLATSAPTLAVAPYGPDRPFGELISVGGHRLHLHCVGEGAPTVVLEAGIGGNHLDWVRAQPAIGRFTRVCSYDRAGYGWSERGPKPRTVSQITGELRALLDKARIEAPVVLVGHSFGGLVSLYYASRFRREVAGLVLVDSMHADQYDRFARAGINVPTEPRGIVYSSPKVLTYGIPREYKELAYELASSDKSRSYMFNELRNVPHSIAEVRASATPVLPASVLVHGNREWDSVTADGRMEDIWLQLQTDLAADLQGPAPVIAAESGHQLPLDDPEAVIGAVRDMVMALRAAAGRDLLEP